MRILITNDDGIHSEGIYELYKTLSKTFNVCVCAPEFEQSSIGHAITVRSPLRIKEVYKESQFFGHCVNGTPVDCIKMALSSVLNCKPDLIISGINHGANLGSDVLYSGTVAAAIEGSIMGIPAVAVSLAAYEKYSFEFTVGFVLKLVKMLEKNIGFQNILFNVNIPAVCERQIQGVRITKQARSVYRENFVKRLDPRGKAYYWLRGKVEWLEKDSDSDIAAIEANYISISPLRFDLTVDKFDLENLNIQLL
ncbi:MAG: 5'/3'-nucleotidase SurE [Candidatus Omnitrophota bacterium]|nr:MAG: 5'/3'-nucleotidase SurE [Candidatus Omnitrophota bacterium]